MKLQCEVFRGQKKGRRERLTIFVEKFGPRDFEVWAEFKSRESWLRGATTYHRTRKGAEKALARLRRVVLDKEWVPMK